MKELSIVEKAKRYDEALTKARNIVNSINVGLIGKDSFEAVFPELRESNDERIRKAIVKMISDIDGGSPFEKYGIIKKEALAWLEKQGEQKPVISNDALREGIAHFGITQYQIDNWLKKYVDVEKQGEQQPTDKAEPKFKVGDWIVYKDNIWKICNISLGSYYELLKINNEVSIRHFEGVDKTAHLWTIQDAKDGDVLSWDNGRYTIIFKESKDNKIIAHCSYNNHSKHFGTQGNYDTTFDSDLKFIPSAKEQRDLLFQKMKEAGYEWDSHTNKIIYNNDYRRLC